MKMKFAIPALAAAAALALTGCVNSEGDTAVTTDTTEITPDAAAVALLPADIKDSGVLLIGVNPTYPPNEFKDSAGNPAGWSVTLTEAVAAKLGLTPTWEILGFDSILPRIEEDTLNLGSSSFTDTLERQKTVDFVNYFNAGSQWAAAVGSNIDPDNACGLAVAVQSGTVQHTDELPQRSEDCVAAGKDAIEILPFDAQTAVTNAVISGQAAAFSADSPVTGAAVVELSDDLELVGDLFEAVQYGFATQKGGDMTAAIQAAVQSLMDDGTYLEILSGAGIESGAIETATINAATS